MVDELYKSVICHDSRGTILWDTVVLDGLYYPCAVTAQATRPNLAWILHPSRHLLAYRIGGRSDFSEVHSCGTYSFGQATVGWHCFSYPHQIVSTTFFSDLVAGLIPDAHPTVLHHLQSDTAEQRMIIVPSLLPIRDNKCDGPEGSEKHDTHASTY